FLKRLRTLASGPTRVAVDIAAFHPAELLKSLVKRGDPGLCFQIIVAIAHQHADTPYAFTLLRIRRKRPRSNRASNDLDKVAPPHSITSSARASSVGGTSRPS